LKEKKKHGQRGDPRAFTSASQGKRGEGSCIIEKRLGRGESCACLQFSSLSGGMRKRSKERKGEERGIGSIAREQTMSRKTYWRY